MDYALIGCGRIAANHIKAAQDNGLNIVALCDIKPEAMEAKITKYSLPTTVKCYNDYKEMLLADKPTLVAICTESGEHARIAIDCLNAGAHVIIEKPIALSLDDADAIIEAGKRNNRKVCACHQNRFNKSIQAMRAALEQGRFGTLMHGAAHIRWNRGQD